MFISDTMRTFIALALTFITLLGLFLGISTLSASIPREALADNLRSSAVTLHDETNIYRILHTPLVLDNFSDAIMINEVASADNERPLYSAMAANYSVTDTIEQPYSLYLKTHHPDSTLTTVNYARYWHGYLATITACLIFTDLNGIRIISWSIIIGLFVATCIMIYRRLPHVYLWAYVVIMLLADIYFIPLSLHFSSCFYITLIASLVFLIWPGIVKNPAISMCAFFIIGSFTSFLDLLTVPIITWGIPMVIFCAISKQKHKIPTIIRLSLCWIAGYILLWSAKWMLASFILDTNIIFDAGSQAIIRTVGQNEHASSALPYLFNRHPVIMWGAIGAAVIALIMIVALIIHYRPDRDFMRRYGYLLLIAAGPIAWYTIAWNHTIEHLNFTRRSIIAIIFPLMIFVFYMIKNHHNKGLTTSTDK